MYWTNNKTGKTYMVVNDDVCDCTNSRNGTRVVLYVDIETGKQFVREHSEFLLKFTQADS
jgi:hypothetical protein